MSRSIALLGVSLWLAACSDAPPTSPASPDAPALAKSATETPELEIKFHEALGVRSRADGRLQSVRGRNVAALQAALDRAGVRDARPLFGLVPAERLDGLERAARERSGRPAPDLRSWHRVSLAPGADVDAVLAVLRALPEVEHANPAPRPAPPPTPDFSAYQTYFSPAPAGSDAEYARTLPGGRGAGVMLVDLEYGWNFNHEDLGIGYWMLISGNLAPDPWAYQCGAALDHAPYYTEHGTAVVGELYARDNGFGVTGAVPDATLRLATPMFWVFYYPALGVLNAAGQMSPGDVLLLEMQHRDPYGQYGPIENEPSVYDAIRTATQAGIIVVEAAGNGNLSLDPPNFGGRFDRGVMDSGAIIVGGGNAALAHSSISGSNYGERVDVQGRGEWVTTTGYGCLHWGGSPASAYTGSFSGTSSASPIVAAAAVSIQGYLKATGRPVLTPAQMRALLVATGTPQTGTRKIGPYPNLREAVAHLDQP
ncbi:MAG TPA: S8 family serine peptidase [Longimicrobium sp.]|nr:S8 family serine peptidase [Longimicrobium sp.]